MEKWNEREMERCKEVEEANTKANYNKNRERKNGTY